MTRHHEDKAKHMGGSILAEQVRAYELMIVGGHDQYEAARIITAERPYGSEICRPEDAQAMAWREQQLRWLRAT